MEGRKQSLRETSENLNKNFFLDKVNVFTLFFISPEEEGAPPCFPVGVEKILSRKHFKVYRMLCCADSLRIVTL